MYCCQLEATANKKSGKLRKINNCLFLIDRIARIYAFWVLAIIVLSCSATPPRPAAPVVARAEPPSTEERYCAWYGDVLGDVLYFGQAAFWSAYRASGEDPRADLAVAGPQLIGRFDLRREQLLAPHRADYGGTASFVGTCEKLLEIQRDSG